MKNLFYKEFKLCLNPFVYIFIILFPLMIFIPNYPLFVGFIYICCVYPLIFLGANKGQPTNDLYYSVLLPIRRKDIITGRMLILSAVQIVPMLIMGALTPAAYALNNYFAKTGTPISIPGLGIDSIVSVFGFGIIGFAIFDFIFFAFYYKKGKSIVAPTIIGVLTFALFMAVTTAILPALFKEYKAVFTVNIGYQFLYLLAAIAIALLIKLLACKNATRKFAKADF